jgi:hypothetical protein
LQLPPEPPYNYRYCPANIELILKLFTKGKGAEIFAPSPPSCESPLENPRNLPQRSEVIHCRGANRRNRYTENSPNCMGGIREFNCACLIASLLLALLLNTSFSFTLSSIICLVFYNMLLNYVPYVPGLIPYTL